MRSRGAWLWMSLACTSLGCAFDSGGGTGGGDTRGTDDDESAGELDTASADDPTVDDDDGQPTSSPTETSATDDGDGTTTMPDGTTGSDTDEPPVVGCPSPLPPEWIFCSDFDGEAPESAFSEWDPDPDRMGIVAAEGRDGSSALEIDHEPANVWSGRAGVYFGDAPHDGIVYADDEPQQEVWVRIFLRTEADWPNVGPGDLFSVDVETDDGDIVSVARAPIYTPTGQQVLGVHAQRCFTGPDPGCGSTMSLGSIAGATTVYDATRSDAWQCIELHVGLDRGGPNGIVELLVDDAQDAVRDDYAFLQGFDANTWNALWITGSWDGGPPQALRRWIDDVVISRAPIGCG
jgi:hypothetical protein